MKFARSVQAVSLAACLAACGREAPKVAPQPMSVADFRRELVGMPLCGTPTTGPLAGKALCTVHLPDGTAVLAGSGMIVRGIWEADNGHICRRNAHDPVDRRRCVDYERAGPNRFRNSDGVEFCIGPCTPPDSAGAGTGAR